MAFPDGWGRKVALTIPSASVSGSGTLSSFPVLITRDNLPDEVCDPSGSNAAQSDGGDLRVTSDEAGTTLLPLEVVGFGHDSVTGQSDAAVELWVKTDVSAISDTVIYLWYNEATASQPAVTDAAGRNAVWSGYNFVSHLGSTTPVDSTGNNTITKVGAPALAAAGVGDGLDFANTAAGTATDYLHAPVADPGNTFVLSAWVDIASAAVQQKPFILRTAANAAHYLDTGFGSQDVRAVINNDFNGIAATGSAFPTALSLLHMRWDGSTVYLYQDGAQVATKAYALTSDPVDQIIIAASNTAGEQAFDGILDEIRLASGDLDEHWIATEYANQGSPATFITTGTPEAPSSSGASVVLAGLSSSGGVGAFLASGSALLGLAGIQSVSGVGDLGVTSGALITLAPTVGTGASGDLSATGGASLTLSGVQSVTDSGVITAPGGAFVTVPAVSATGQSGTIIVSVAGGVTVALSGVTATGVSGDPVSLGGAFTALSGDAATALAGAIGATGSSGVTLSGVSAIGDTGTITLNAGDTVVTLSGIGATGQVGAISVSGGAQVAISGVDATGGAGTTLAILDATGRLVGTITITPALSASNTITSALSGSVTIN